MILGLTGAFGGGKSTVLDYFRQHNWHTFDADAECHKLYESGPPMLINKVIDLFGSGAIDANNRINRQLIAKTAFKNPEKMQELTRTLYPLLNEIMDRTIAQCRSKNINAVFELPLLYEGDYQSRFDAVLAIWSDPEVRCQRLKNRNYTREDMLKRDARQLAPELKLEYADFAVVNNGSAAMLHAQLDELIAAFN